MGAATALLHGERDPSIAGQNSDSSQSEQVFCRLQKYLTFLFIFLGMVLDSAFADLTMLAEEMVSKRTFFAIFYRTAFIVQFISH